MVAAAVILSTGAPANSSRQSPIAEDSLLDSDTNLVSTTARSCFLCAAPLFSLQPCRSCRAAEEVARDLNVPTQEMLEVARAQWLLAEGSPRTFVGIARETVPEQSTSPVAGHDPIALV